MGTYRAVVQGGTRVAEATAIVKVNSADIVADPAAGGQAVRMVAGGTGDEPGEPREEVPHDRSTARGRAVIAQEATAWGLPPEVADKLGATLPERFSEAQLTTAIDAALALIASTERAGLAPTLGAVVTQEALDKKEAALDAFFTVDGTPGGYRSLREAYLDVTGHRVRFLDEDLNRRILRDSYGTGFDSATRTSESLAAASWAQVLGDSVTRRMVAEYGRPAWQDWRRIVSAITFGTDFRVQRRARFGGYGLLPAVSEGSPYQPLTSPPDEEATYQLTKRGGTEDITLEMLANDDIAAIRRIPIRLGRSAATTLYRFVFDLLATNAATSYDATSYDATALFHATHGNTDNPAVLGQSTLTAGRRKMRKQAAYADASDVLSIVPRFLIVPSDLEEIAYQLRTSVVAVPATPAGPTDTPNIHQGMVPITVDYYTDANDWYLMCDPMMCPTIEIGFYSTADTPELFTQSDQTFGSMFDADKLTMKIRHIYSGTVIDHRGFYRGC